MEDKKLSPEHKAKIAEAMKKVRSNPETNDKYKVRTLDRAYAQMLRSCDSRVGRWLRLFRKKTYNKILTKVDNDDSR